MHDLAKPQHGPTVLIGYKFKAVRLFKNLSVSIAHFSSQSQVLLLGVHVSLVDTQQESHSSGKEGDGPTILVGAFPTL